MVKSSRKSWWLGLLGLCLLVGLGDSPASGAGQPWRWLLSLRGGADTLFQLPTALYVDEGRGRYYVIDSGGQRLYSFDREGQFLQSYPQQGGLANPYDMVRLPSDDLLVVEKGKNSLTLIDVKNRSAVANTVSYRGRQIFVDRISQVGEVLYVLDKATGDIFRLDEKMQAGQQFPAPKAARAIVDFQVVDGKVWALSQLDRRLYQFDNGGKLLSQLELGESLSFPVSFTLDKAGNFYVLDRHLGEVVVYDQQGKEKYRFLGKGHAREKLYYPNAIRFDPWGRLCIVDEGNGRVEIFAR
ncbi:hypothetical protein ACUUL3_11440 [Thiovibrio sp. JS02]